MRCDFCGSVMVRWAHPAKRDWLACVKCHVAIRPTTGKPFSTAPRRFQSPGPFPTATAGKFLERARRLHHEFWETRAGSASPRVAAHACGPSKRVDACNALRGGRTEMQQGGCCFRRRIRRPSPAGASQGARESGTHAKGGLSKAPFRFPSMLPVTRDTAGRCRGRAPSCARHVPRRG